MLCNANVYNRQNMTRMKNLNNRFKRRLLSAHMTDEAVAKKQRKTLRIIVIDNHLQNNV